MTPAQGREATLPTLSLQTLPPSRLKFVERVLSSSVSAAGKGRRRRPRVCRLQKASSDLFLGPWEGTRGLPLSTMTLMVALRHHERLNSRIFSVIDTSIPLTTWNVQTFGTRPQIPGKTRWTHPFLQLSAWCCGMSSLKLCSVY